MRPQAVPQGLALWINTFLELKPLENVLQVVQVHGIGPKQHCIIFVFSGDCAGIHVADT